MLGIKIDVLLPDYSGNYSIAFLTYLEPCGGSYEGLNLKSGTEKQ